MELSQIIMSVLTLGVTGETVSRLVFKSNRRLATAQASQAETQAREEEFRFLREQVELVQRQNLELTRTLMESNRREVELTSRLGQAEARASYLDMWKCESGDCQQRLPPNPVLRGLKFGL